MNAQTKDWWLFIKELVGPISDLFILAIFFIVHLLIAKSIFHSTVHYFSAVLLFIGITLFYFSIRLYEERKQDTLAKRLLSSKDRKRGIIFCTLVETGIFALQGLASLWSFGLMILYSILLFKYLFLKRKGHAHLTLYTLLRTFIIFFLSIAILSSLSQKHFLAILFNKKCLYFALVNWMLINIFEFGRNIFTTIEERTHIATYSSLFGKWGACLLVLSQALIAHVLIFKIYPVPNLFLEWTHAFLFLSLIIFSLQYIDADEIKNARRYRTMSSLYSIIFYVTLAITYATQPHFQIGN